MRHLFERTRGDGAGQRDGLLVREWTYSNPKPAKSKRRNWSVYEIESEPGVIISTFTSHQEITAAYGARATVKAAVTPQCSAVAPLIREGRELKLRAALMRQARGMSPSLSGKSGLRRSHR